MKIGFFGGSFDPVHFGHLLVAQDVFERQRLDRLVFIPAAQSALKPAPAYASATHRMEMLKAAIDADTRFEVSDFEVSCGGTSFTVHSARHFRRLYPDDDLYWIIGADQLSQLHRWKDIEELAALVGFIVVDRPGCEAAVPDAIPHLRVERVHGHVFAVSSTELRERFRRRLALDYFMPHNAIAYALRERLYRDGT